MLEYAFQFVSKVYFHIGANNIRSQIATVRLGTDKIEEQTVTYSDGTFRLNFLYVINKKEWRKQIKE